jgi:hypothetical protein
MRWRSEISLVFNSDTNSVFPHDFSTVPTLETIAALPRVGAAAVGLTRVVARLSGKKTSDDLSAQVSQWHWDDGSDSSSEWPGLKFDHPFRHLQVLFGVHRQRVECTA